MVIHEYGATVLSKYPDAGKMISFKDESGLSHRLNCLSTIKKAGIVSFLRHFPSKKE
jgi:hypothetical protein